MKRLLLAVFMLAIQTTSLSAIFAQVKFQRTFIDTSYSVSGQQYALAIIQTLDGGFVVAGVGGLIKVSADGLLQWQSTVHSYTSVTELSSGPIVAVGPNGMTFYTVQGGITLDTAFSEPCCPEYPLSVIADDDTAIVLASKNQGGDSLIVRWVGANGAVVSTASLPGKPIRLYVNNTFSTYPNYSIIRRSIDYIVASDTVLYGIARSGDVLWSREFRDGIAGIRSAYKHDEVFLQRSPNKETGATTVLHLDSSMNALDTFSCGQGFAASQNGLMTVGLGYTYPGNSRVGYSLLYDLKSPATSNLNYYSTFYVYHRGGWNSLIDVIPTFDGGYALAGLYGGSFSESPVRSGSRFYIIKTDSLGATDSLSYFDFSPLRVDARDSQQNFRILPNPGTGQIKVIGQTEQIREIQIQNVLGTTVFAVHSPTAAAFDLSSLPAGVYYLCVRADPGRHNVLRFMKE